MDYFIFLSLLCMCCILLYSIAPSLKRIADSLENKNKILKKLENKEEDCASSMRKK